jgi:3-dehydroquinate synthase
MKRIIIEGKSGTSGIYIGESLNNVQDYLPKTSVFIISDTNVYKLYGNKFPSAPVYVVEPGEQSKEFPVIAKIWQWLLDNGADRGSFILAIGGGVVSDIAGFAAATFMRGIPFGFVASTLLAQVDASVGGKNGINLHGYKNIIGTFTQPEFVLCDTSMLATLPTDEYISGMAEVIKHAIIQDAVKFDFLQQNQKSLMNLEKDAVDHIVFESVRIKAAIVQADEREQGLRRLLNFGHTWGHAIEKIMKIPHGQAVSIGMVFAAGLSVELGYLKHQEKEKIISLLSEYNLSVTVNPDKNLVFEAMLKDKKKNKQSIHYVLIDKIGNAFVKEIAVDDLKKYAL